MTLGERLQQLRKEKQMSQEELGNLLLVSRQTVSLWENNQTVPTVDNLIRLKEVFGVSVDSILTGEEEEKTKVTEHNPQQQPEPQTPDFFDSPLERHSFSLDKKDLKYIYKIFTMPLLKKLVVSAFFFFFSVFATFSDTSEEQNTAVLIILALIFIGISLSKYINGLKVTKKSVESVCSRKYTYETFNNYVLVRVFNSDVEIKSQKVFFNEINSCWETPFCYFLEFKDKKAYFIIKKSALEENSRLGYFCHNLKTSKTDFSSTKITALKTLGNVLFIGCFISFFTAITILIDTVPENPAILQDGFDSFRIFRYFLPVPVLSIAAGILLNVNKIRNKKNIICGIVIGLMMLVYGFFPTIFGNVGNSLDTVEAQLGFKFPETTQMNYKVSTDISGNEQAVTTLNFAESDANEFEKFMQEDNRWIKESNEEIKEIIPVNSGNIPADYFLIYNTGTKEFGKFPENDGKYQFIYIAYNSELNMAYIFEYSSSVE